ncbi:hypothetical protein [Haemophilus influenzae]|nr:hypothetical protein [Haemophilus influenzae]
MQNKSQLYAKSFANLYMVNKTAQLKQALENRILILDGAMGTMIQKYKLT